MILLSRKTVLTLAPLLALLCMSCAALKLRPTAVEEPRLQMKAADAAIARADSLYRSGAHNQAAAILKALGQQGYSYYRMDEVLYLLGRCQYGLGDMKKSVRCFDLLRKYYSRCEFIFPDLPRWEEAARAAADTIPNEPVEETPLANSEQPLVSNVFFDTDIRQALADLADQTGVSIVPDPMVQGYVTLALDNVPLETALRQLLAPLGLIYQKLDGYYIVAQASPESPSFPAIAETRAVTLKYLKVSELKNLLPKHYLAYLNTDDKSDIVTITAPQQVIRDFMHDLSAVDVPREQFMIEVLVVEIGKDARRALGLDWDWTGTKGDNSFTVSKLLPINLDSSFFAEIFLPNEKPWGTVSDLRLAVRALATRDKVQIKANPQVTTQHGYEATIRAGKELYYSIVSGPVNYPYVTLEKIATGITLKITPYMGRYSEITNEVIIDVTDVTGAGANNLPVTSVRSVNTKVTVANGQTFGIGGLLSENNREERNRIPFLGDIPLLGYLFGTTTTRREQTEVVVLITPHLLINPNEFDLL